MKKRKKAFQARGRRGGGGQPKTEGPGSAVRSTPETAHCSLSSPPPGPRHWCLSSSFLAGQRPRVTWPGSQSAGSEAAALCSSAPDHSSLPCRGGPGVVAVSSLRSEERRVRGAHSSLSLRPGPPSAPSFQPHRHAPVGHRHLLAAEQGPEGNPGQPPLVFRGQVPPGIAPQGQQDRPGARDIWAMALAQPLIPGPTCQSTHLAGVCSPSCTLGIARRVCRGWSWETEARYRQQTPRELANPTLVNGPCQGEQSAWLSPAQISRTRDCCWRLVTQQCGGGC